jgi:hypothetical protein
MAPFPDVDLRPRLDKLSPSGREIYEQGGTILLLLGTEG